MPRQGTQDSDASSSDPAGSVAVWGTKLGCLGMIWADTLNKFQKKSRLYERKDLNFVFGSESIQAYLILGLLCFRCVFLATSSLYP